jgi:hypothetical protein
MFHQEQNEASEVSVTEDHLVPQADETSALQNSPERDRLLT